MTCFTFLCAFVYDRTILLTELHKKTERTLIFTLIVGLNHLYLEPVDQPEGSAEQRQEQQTLFLKSFDQLCYVKIDKSSWMKQ